ncbi:hypothetical protein NRP93_001289 [Clostridium botulinum]|nr:hypothetical protein [Clostridium botulinum]
MEIIKKKKKFKLNWNKYKTVILLSFFIAVSGFFVVSNTMPKFVKDRSKIAIYFTKKPLDVRFRTENYTFYINEKVLNNLGNKTYKTFNNIKKSTNNFIHSINKGHSFNKVGNAVYKIKQSILEVFSTRGVK